MYKNSSLLIAALICALLLVGCKASESQKLGKWLTYAEKAALEEQQLRKELKVEKREAMTNQVTDSGETWFPSEVILYNTYGMPTLNQSLDATGKVTKETRSTNKDSLIIAEEITEATGYTSKLTYGYNAQGQKIKEVFFQRGDSILKREYKLDALGNEMEVNLLKFRDGAKFQLLTKRDNLGRPDTVREMQEGKANWTEAYELTDSLWRIQRWDAENKLQSDYEMRFDANGAIRQMINRNPDGQVRMSIVHTNDKSGRPLKDQFMGAQGKPMQSTTYKYDDKGLLIERTMEIPGQAAGVVTKYTYSYRK
jgi:hypothetical protein